MELHLYKTLWGHEGTIESACEQALEHGFVGLEGGPSGLRWSAEQLKKALSATSLNYIAEICTAGSYVPKRMASVQDHLVSFTNTLRQALDLNPQFITCLGGCDAWQITESVDFFGSAISIAKQFGMDVSFETHRGRSLFNPFAARLICEQLPDLQLTCDFSHWCVVCERLLDTEDENLTFFFERARHVHARVGFDQGAQVSNPASDLYRNALNHHLDWWQAIWHLQEQRGFEISSMTPEFGPDGYQIRNDQNGEVIGDIWHNNCWMADMLSKHFSQTFS